MFDMKALVIALYQSGDIPSKQWANNVYALAHVMEDSAESVAITMDLMGLDGDVAYDMALELD